MQIKDYMSDFHKTLSILCVEDDEIIMQMYKSVFSMIFKEVYCAKDGIEGVEIFENNTIDIVLTDYLMPKQNGLEMSAVLREIDESIPIILVTSMDNVEVLREAISLHTTSFLSKPFTSTSLLSVFNVAVKSILAERTMKREQKKLLDYSQYQENLSFEKEKTIAKNDVEKNGEITGYKCDVYYRPRDILSGDSYSIRKINDDEYLLFIVDGMGKGISASVSAMLCSAAVNYHVSSLKDTHKPFIMQSFIEYIFAFMQDNLLDDEVISAQFIRYVPHKGIVEYAIFSMPPILFLKSDGSLHKIRSNNPPLGKYGEEFIIDTHTIDDITKVLMYSDGLNENSVDNGENSYAYYLKDHFVEASDAMEFQALLEKYILVPEDDITYIYLQK